MERIWCYKQSSYNSNWKWFFNSICPLDSWWKNGKILLVCLFLFLKQSCTTMHHQLKLLDWNISLPFWPSALFGACLLFWHPYSLQYKSYCLGLKISVNFPVKKISASFVRHFYLLLIYSIQIFCFLATTSDDQMRLTGSPIVKISLILFMACIQRMGYLLRKYQEL